MDCGEANKLNKRAIVMVGRREVRLAGTSVAQTVQRIRVSSCDGGGDDDDDDDRANKRNERAIVMVGKREVHSRRDCSIVQLSDRSRQLY